jgi:hypothetical protein
MRLSCGTVLYGNMGGLPGYTAWMLSSAGGHRQIAVAATTDELPRVDRAIHRVVEAAFCPTATSARGATAPAVREGAVG